MKSRSTGAGMTRAGCIPGDLPGEGPGGRWPGQQGAQAGFPYLVGTIFFKLF